MSQENEFDVIRKVIESLADSISEEDNSEDNTSLEEDPNMDVNSTNLKNYMDSEDEETKLYNKMVDSKIDYMSRIASKNAGKHENDDLPRISVSDIVIDIGEFAYTVSKDILGYENSDLKDFATELENVIDMVINTALTNYAIPNFHIYDDGKVVKGHVEVSDNTVTVYANEYRYELHLDREKNLNLYHTHELDNYDDNECEQSLGLSMGSVEPYPHEVRDDILDSIDDLEESYNEIRDAILDNIEDFLGETLDNPKKDDLKLVKFYMLQKPHNSQYDVESASDEALRLAWNYRNYSKDLKY